MRQLIYVLILSSAIACEKKKSDSNAGAGATQSTIPSTEDSNKKSPATSSSPSATTSIDPNALIASSANPGDGTFTSTSPGTSAPPSAPPGVLSDEMRPIMQAFGQNRPGVKLDFDGDSKHDIGKVWNDVNGGKIDFHFSNGSAYNMTRVETRDGTFKPLGINRTLTGDFNGDGKTDVAHIFQCPGTNNACIDIEVSNGANALSFQRWSTNQGGIWASQQWFTGDFNGDGRTDIGKCWVEFVDQKQILDCDVHFSQSNNTFEMVRWVDRQGIINKRDRIFVGDANGDGKDDLIKIFGGDQAGHVDIYVDVHLSGSNSATMVRWGNQFGWLGSDNDVQFFAGDFDGNGKTDILYQFKCGPNSNEICLDAYFSLGHMYANQRYQTQAGLYGAQSRFLVGDFNGDGIADFAHVFADGQSGGYNLTSFDIYPGAANRTTSRQRWATNQGAIGSDQNWYVSDFKGSGRSSIGKWWTAKPGPTWWEMFADMHISDTLGSFAMSRVADRQGAADQFYTPSNMLWFQSRIFSN